MATKAKKRGRTRKRYSLRGAKRVVKKGERLGRSAKLKRRGRKGTIFLTELDFEHPVIYRGITIEPTMAVGKRSALARAIRNDLRNSRVKSA
jgi:hypothetical protein